DPCRGQGPGERETSGWRRAVTHVERGRAAEGQRPAGYRPTRDPAVDTDDLVQAERADPGELRVHVSIGGVGSGADTETVDATSEVDAVKGRGGREDSRSGCCGDLLAQNPGVAPYLDVPGAKDSALAGIAARRRRTAGEPRGWQDREPGAVKNPEDVRSAGLSAAIERLHLGHGRVHVTPDRIPVAVVVDPSDCGASADEALRSASVEPEARDGRGVGWRRQHRPSAGDLGGRVRALRAGHVRAGQSSDASLRDTP